MARVVVAMEAVAAQAAKVAGVTVVTVVAQGFLGRGRTARPEVPAEGARAASLFRSTREAFWMAVLVVALAERMSSWTA